MPDRVGRYGAAIKETEEQDHKLVGLDTPVQSTQFPPIRSADRAPSDHTHPYLSNGSCEALGSSPGTAPLDSYPAHA